MNFVVEEEQPKPVIFEPASVRPPNVTVNSTSVVNRVAALEEFAKVMLKTYEITQPSGEKYEFTAQPQNLVE